MLEKVGAILLDGDQTPEEPHRLLMAKDCFELIDPSARSALTTSKDLLSRYFGGSTDVTVCPGNLNSWRECFSTIQGAEIWANLGPWITMHAPKLGPGIKDRIVFASDVTSEQESAARSERETIVKRLDDIIKPGSVLCLPSAPRAAPLKGTATSTIEITYRHQAICLLCIAGLGGLPQISLPMAKIDGLPLGISLIGAAGSDLQLLRLACKLHTS